MGIDMKTLFVLLFCCMLCSCGGGDSKPASAVSQVDSAAQAAPDTLRASMDTSSRKKDTALTGDMAGKRR